MQENNAIWTEYVIKYLLTIYQVCHESVDSWYNIITCEHFQTKKVHVIKPGNEQLDQCLIQDQDVGALQYQTEHVRNTEHDTCIY